MTTRYLTGYLVPVSSAAGCGPIKVIQETWPNWAEANQAKYRHQLVAEDIAGKVNAQNASSNILFTFDIQPPETTPDT